MFSYVKDKTCTSRSILFHILFFPLLEVESQSVLSICFSFRSASNRARSVSRRLMCLSTCRKVSSRPYLHVKSTHNNYTACQHAYSMYIYFLYGIYFLFVFCCNNKYQYIAVLGEITSKCRLLTKSDILHLHTAFSKIICTFLHIVH